MLAAMLLPPPATAAANPAGADTVPDAPRPRAGADEPYASGWSFYIDNDFLSPVTSSDQQYTGGFALTLAGRRAREYPWSLDPVLGRIDRATGWASLYRGARHEVAHSWELGMTAFTPDDVDSRAPIPDDHPYAGLVFVGNTRDVRLHERRVNYLSSFSLGLLGTGIPERVQDGFHELADDDKARGWENQISDGGEPTFALRARERELRGGGRRPVWGSLVIARDY